MNVVTMREGRPMLEPKSLRVKASHLRLLIHTRIVGSGPTEHQVCDGPVEARPKSGKRLEPVRKLLRAPAGDRATQGDHGAPFAAFMVVRGGHIGDEASGIASLHDLSDHAATSPFRTTSVPNPPHHT